MYKYNIYMLKANKTYENQYKRKSIQPIDIRKAFF